MSQVSLVLRTIVAWVDIKDRIGQRPPVYCMICPCFITQVYFSPAFFQATQHKQISRHLLLVAHFFCLFPTLLESFKLEWPPLLWEIQIKFLRFVASDDLTAVHSLVNYNQSKALQSYSIFHIINVIEYLGL